MSSVSFAEAKSLVLARLRQWLQELPEAERRRPRLVIEFKPMSVLSLIVEVEMETELGLKYIYDTIKRLGYIIEE